MKHIIDADKKELKQKLIQIKHDIWDIERKLPHDLLMRRARLWRKWDVLERELEQIRVLEKEHKERVEKKVKKK